MCTNTRYLNFYVILILYTYAYLYKIKFLEILTYNILLPMKISQFMVNKIKTYKTLLTIFYSIDL